MGYTRYSEWPKVADAVIKAKTNMEIFGIQARGNVSVPVSGNTGLASGHQHGVNLTGVQNNVVFTRTGDIMRFHGLPLILCLAEIHRAALLRWLTY